MTKVNESQKLFIISDHFGNYYRLNENEELVVARDKGEACVFTEEEAKDRIGKGKKNHFYKTIPAGSLENENCTLAVANSEEDSICSRSGSADAASKSLSDPWDVDDLSEINWKDLLQNIVYINTMLPAYKDRLREDQSSTELLIQDILHFVELYDYDQQKALDVMEMLREAREKRRIIKNELVCVERFQSLIGNSTATTHAKQILVEIWRMDKRSYRPRFAEGLFTDSKLRLKREFSSYASRLLPDTCTVEEEDNLIEEGTYDMTYEHERIGTIYDNVQTDWTGLVRSQLEFFQNAPQHIIDLQCDLESIDAAIESALALIEDANYNVAQGFKAYKELRDLRNRRKEILSELYSVQMITERFDCSAMYDIYAEILSDMLPEESIPQQENTTNCDPQLIEDNDSSIICSEENPVAAVS